MKFREFMYRYAKTYMIACMMILLGAVGITYAYYAATVSNTTVVTGQAGGGVAPTLSVDLVSDDATGNLIPIDMNTDILTKAASASNKCVDNNGYSVCQIYSVTVTNNSDLTQSYYITLSNLYGENTPNIDAVTMGTSNNAVANATSIKSTGNICTTNSVRNGETTNACYFMVVIKNLNDVQTDNGTFGGTVTATSTTGGEVKADFGDSNLTLIEHITSLYTRADKTEVINNGITYNYAPTVRLMNDRLGNSEVDADGGNIRYYGADDSDLNNYIYFQCSDYSNQSSSTCETWRILGIIDGKVKLIRNESIGNHQYFEELDIIDDTSIYSNVWNTSELNEDLEKYCSESQTRKLISYSTWYTNGMSNSNMYANESYIGERTGTSIWSGYVALAYPSDYGYSANLNDCQSTLSNYHEETCTSVNWITTPFKVNKPHWLMTPNSENTSGIWGIQNGGQINSNALSDGYLSVLPTLYLEPTLSIDKKTDGSSNSPYKLIVK